MALTTPFTKEEMELRNTEWGKLTDPQKIERMRDIIKDLQRSLGYQLNSITKVQNDFYTHQHSDDGTIVKKITQFGGEVGGLNSVSKLANPNFF